MFGGIIGFTQSIIARLVCFNAALLSFSVKIILILKFDVVIEGVDFILCF